MFNDLRSTNDESILVKLTYINDNPINKKKGRKGTELITVLPFKKWGVFGKGDYPKKCSKYMNRWCVAVGPKILDTKYDNNGQVQADDFKGFSKIIRVHLKSKKDGSNKSIELYVADLKAHTYNKYPNKAKYKSDFVTKAKAYIWKYNDKIKRKESKLIPNGIIQTGIRYPKSIIKEEDSVVAVDNVDGTIIEFCGAYADIGFELNDYELTMIETNFENKTRGKAIVKPWK